MSTLKSMSLFLLFLGLITAITAQDYPIKFERQPNVGDRYNYRFDVAHTVTKQFIVNGRVTKKDSTSKRLLLVSDMIVNKVNPQSNSIDEAHTVVKAQGTKGIKKGDIVSAKVKTGSVKSFKLNDQDCDPELSQFLSKVIHIDIKPADFVTDDEMFGIKSRQKKGSSWPINKQKICEFLKSEKVATDVNPDDIEGEVKLTTNNQPHFKVENTQIDALELQVHFNVKNLKAQVPPPFKVKQAELSMTSTYLLPANPYLTCFEIQSKIDLKLVATGKPFPNKPALDLKVDNTRNVLARVIPKDIDIKSIMTDYDQLNSYKDHQVPFIIGKNITPLKKIASSILNRKYKTAYKEFKKNKLDIPELKTTLKELAYLNKNAQKALKKNVGKTVNMKTAMFSGNVKIKKVSSKTLQVTKGSKKYGIALKKLKRSELERWAKELISDKAKAILTGVNNLKKGQHDLAIKEFKSAGSMTLPLLMVMPKKSLIPKKIAKRFQKPIIITPLSMKLLPVKPGKYHTLNLNGKFDITLTRPFWIGQYEVTQKQYERLMKTNPSLKKNDKFPVYNISFNDAVKFCQRLNQKEKRLIPEGYTFRLPTECEWEYCCRAGSNKEYRYFDNVKNIDKLANFGKYKEKVKDKQVLRDSKDGFEDLAPVGSLKANNWKLYNMLGNIREYTYFQNYLKMGAKPVDPEFIEDCPASRGGCYADLSFRCVPNSCSSIKRDKDYSQLSNLKQKADRYCGFRIVLAPKLKDTRFQ